MKRDPKAKAKRQGDKTDRTRARVKKTRFLNTFGQSAECFPRRQSYGRSPLHCYEWRDSDPQFAEAWEQALDASVDNLVVAAFKRALKSSDTLLTFLLRCRPLGTLSEIGLGAGMVPTLDQRIQSRSQ
jgi:hypothetical protein